MEIEKIISYFIGNAFISMFSLLVWNKLEPIKKTKAQWFFVWILIAMIITLYTYLLPNPIKMITTVLTLIMINFLLLTKNLKSSIILIVISQMILALAEFSFVIACSAFWGNEIYDILFEPLPSILLNIYIFSVSMLISKTKLIKKIYFLFYNNIKNKENLIYPLIIISILIIATIESHINLPLPIVLITNVIMAIIFISIIITSTKIKENYEKISSKYENSISSLKEYEVMIDKFRVDTHENKNEFRTIRNMLKAKAKKDDVIKYIDKLIDNKIKDNDKIMKKTAKIPEGGLRATIYSKLCLMDTLNVKYRLNISRDVRTTDLINLDEDLVLKICKILGVFLDNAIEAVKELNKKEIVVEIYTMDNNLCIDVTNNFKGSLDLEKISNIKYTTKGDGHGYGLTLVNKLLEEESDKLENEKSINRDTFTQTLKIKM